MISSRSVEREDFQQFKDRALKIYNMRPYAQPTHYLINALNSQKTGSASLFFLEALSSESFACLSNDNLVLILNIMRSKKIPTPTIIKSSPIQNMVSFLNDYFFKKAKNNSNIQTRGSVGALVSSSTSPSSFSKRLFSKSSGLLPFSAIVDINTENPLSKSNFNDIGMNFSISNETNQQKTSSNILIDTSRNLQPSNSQKIIPSPLDDLQKKLSDKFDIMNPDVFDRTLQRCHLGVVPYKVHGIIGCGTFSSSPAAFLFNNDTRNDRIDFFNSQMIEDGKFAVVVLVYNVITKRFVDDKQFEVNVEINNRKFASIDKQSISRNVSHLWPSSNQKEVYVKFENSPRISELCIGFVCLVEGLGFIVSLLLTKSSFDDRIVNFYKYEVSKLNQNIGIQLASPIKPPVVINTHSLNISNLANNFTTGTKKRKHEEDEVEIGDAKISFKCPLSLKRIAHPVKGLNCGGHLQCTDLESILRSSKSNTIFKCGHCNKIMTGIKLDATMLWLLMKYPNDDGCIIKADGSDEKIIVKSDNVKNYEVFDVEEI